MKSDEAQDLGKLTGTELREVTALVQGTHETISDIVHTILRATVGPSASPAQAMHETIAAGAYAAAGFGLNAAARVTGFVAGQRLRGRDADLPSIHDAPRGHQALAIALGLRGDAVSTDTPSIALPMHVRRAGRRIELTPEAVQAAYPQATPAIAVFLHGLFEAEASWQLGARERTPYAVRLAADRGLTAVKVRYNTGLRISENGHALGELLGDLVAAWPVPVERIVLIGHSMGGLVLHSALAQADPDAPWLEAVTDTVSLGSPHHGSPVARGVHHAAELLSSAQRGRGLGAYLQRRSAGVRDLAHGNVLPTDWEGHEPGDLTDRRTHPPVHPGIRHYAVIAVLGPTPTRVSRHIGDLLVPFDSARHLATDDVPSRFEEDRVAVLHGMHHLRLLNDERVSELLHDWL
jgi:hypothetical protein